MPLLLLLFVELHLPIGHLTYLVGRYQRVSELLAAALHGVGLTAIAHLAVEFCQ